MIINTSNGPKVRKLEEKENNKNHDKQKLIILIILCILLIIGIIVYKIYINYSKDFNYLKEDKNDYLVYTRYNQNQKTVPYINIKSNDIKDLNEEIVEYCNQYVNIDSLLINYEYNINGNYLSVVIKVIDQSKEIPSIGFKTYNINIKNRKVVTDEELLNYFKVDKDQVYKSIENKFKEMYKEEVDKGYIMENICNYDCYLRFHDIDDYTSNISYLIKNGKLTVYKPFNYSSIFGEEDFFTEESFQITIK